MNKPKDKIEELFQGHMDDFDKMPDDSLWDEIEAHLPPVTTPVYRLWRWGLAAAILLFSLVGYVAYQSFSTGSSPDIIGAKDNGLKHSKGENILSNQKDTKKAIQKHEKILTKEDAVKGEVTDTEPENNKIEIAENASRKTDSKAFLKIDKNSLGNEGVTKESVIGKVAKNSPINLAENKTRKKKTDYQNKANKNSGFKTSTDASKKTSEFITQYSERKNRDKKQKIETEKNPEQPLALTTNNTKKNAIAEKLIIGEEQNNQAVVLTEKEMTERFASPDYLKGHETSLAGTIPLNTHITYEAEYERKEPKESFFKIPSEGYISFTPSLSYYRVFSSMPINQFNGANNGGRLGWALQAGVVYPLKIRRFSYRVGLGFFSAQSNFKYNLLSGRQQPIRLNNNTFEYVNIESTQLESKKWQVFEIQNDLMYKVRPMQELILGFKTGGNLGQKAVFDAYTGYRFSKAISHHQTFWIEIAYAYALNAQQSSRNNFSYHMDKYSLRVGLNYR